MDGWMGWSLSPHIYCLFSPCIRPVTAVCVPVRALAESKRPTGFFFFARVAFVVMCVCARMIPVCVRASPSTQRPSQSPLAGWERVQRSNEGVISLAGRLLHY